MRQEIYGSMTLSILSHEEKLGSNPPIPTCYKPENPLTYGLKIAFNK